MTVTLDDFYAQMLAAAPPDEAALVEGAPPMGPAGFPPYATPAFPEFAFGGGMPGAAPPESAQPDPMLGVNPGYGPATTAAAQYGYDPRPRPMLPPQIADPAAGLYGPFRGVWEQMQAEPDPLAALMAGPEQEPQLGMGDPRTPPLPEQLPPYGQQGAFVAGPAQGGERVLHGRGYGRVLDRVNWLRSLRGQKGF